MPKRIPPLEELQLRRIDILTACGNAKTSFLRDLLARRLEAAHRDLFTITKNSIYR